MLYLLILVSSFLDYRLIPWNPQLNYIRLGIIVLLLVFFVPKVKEFRKLKYDKLFCLLIGYSAFKFISFVWSIDQVDALLSSGFWLSLSFLYLLFTNISLQSKKIKDIETVIIIAGVFNSVVALTQGLLFYYFNIKAFNIYGWDWPWGFRVTGLSFDANHLAAFLLLPIYLSLSRLIKRKNIFYLLPLITFLVVFYFSASRSGLLALLFGIVSYVLLSINWRTVSKVLKTGVFILIPSVLTLIYVFYIPLVNSRETTQFNSWNAAVNETAQKFLIHGRGIDRSALAHFALIHSSFYIQSSNYFLGVGSGNFAEGIKQNEYTSKVYGDIDPDVLQKPDFPAHSMFAEALGEGGFIGLATFLAILITLSSRYQNNKRRLPYFVFLLSASLFMVFYSLNEEFFWLFAFIGLLDKKD